MQIPVNAANVDWLSFHQTILSEIRVHQTAVVAEFVTAEERLFDLGVLNRADAIGYRIVAAERLYRRN